MPNWRCFIRGTGFPGAYFGDDQLYGFYTTRWVQALNRRHAERKALAMMRVDPRLQPPKPRFPWQRRADMRHARIHFERIERVRHLPRMRGGGATWFSETPDPSSAFVRLSERLSDARDRRRS